MSENWSRSMHTYSRRPGITQLEQHRIEMTTKDPIKVKSCPMPYAMQEIINEDVEAMLEADIIEPSKSAYCSLVVIVEKRDGSNKFCIDFRKLNLMTNFDTESMGNPDDIMAILNGNKFFTKIDLSKGYWHIQMVEESKELTAFGMPAEVISSIG